MEAMVSGGAQQEEVVEEELKTWRNTSILERLGRRGPSWARKEEMVAPWPLPASGGSWRLPGLLVHFLFILHVVIAISIGK
jgi:hypothetical protein